MDTIIVSQVITYKELHPWSGKVKITGKSARTTDEEGMSLATVVDSIDTACETCLTYGMLKARLVVSGRTSIVVITTGSISKGKDDLTMAKTNGGGLRGMAPVALDLDGNARGRTGKVDTLPFSNKKGKSDAVGVAGNNGPAIATKDSGSKELHTGKILTALGETVEDTILHHVASE